MRRPIRILFSGYAPVHFVCFRPIYERLRARPGFEFYFSGGLRTKGSGVLDPFALYRPFQIPPERILTIDRMRRRAFDIAFCAHTKGFFPARRCLRVQIFHGVSFRNAAVRRRQRDYDRFFVVGPYQMRALRRRGVLRPGDPRAVPVGFPKLDPLLDGRLDRARILRRLRIRGDRPVLLYAPTGARFNSLETMGEEVIERLAAADRFDLLIKPHDHPKKPVDWFRRLRRFEGPHVRLVRDFDVVPSMAVADLLISDASSVASEFTLLDRPIVFLDVPRLIAEARRKGGMLDLHTHGRRTGFTVRSPREIVRVVRRCLSRPGLRSKARRAAARDLFYNPGRATDAAVAAILKLLGRRFAWVRATASA